jgi:hypothetical protein
MMLLNSTLQITRAGKRLDDPLRRGALRWFVG